MGVVRNIYIYLFEGFPPPVLTFTSSPGMKLGCFGTNTKAKNAGYAQKVKISEDTILRVYYYLILFIYIVKMFGGYTFTIIAYTFTSSLTKGNLNERI